MDDTTVISGGTWLTGLGELGGLTWSHRAAGGCWEASWRMSLSPKFAHPALRRGSRVLIKAGPATLWQGIMNVPEPSADGWTFTASGLSREGARFLALTGAGASTSTPDTAIDQGIALGLPWTRPVSLSGAPHKTGDVTNALNYINPLLDQWSDEAGKRWGVGADGAVYARTDPTTPSWYLTPGAGLMGIDDEDYATHLYGRYIDGGGNYQTATVGDQRAADEWGRVEHAVDLTGLGAIDNARATGVLAGMLAKGAARLGWSDSLEPSKYEMSNAGGAAADYRFVIAGQMVRAHGITDQTRPGRAAVDVVIGESRHSAEDRSVVLLPVDKAPRTLSEVFSVDDGRDSEWRG